MTAIDRASELRASFVHAGDQPGRGTAARAYAAGYLQCLTSLLANIDLNQVERIVRHLRNARDSGASVYVIGNGGSAATASHFAQDLAHHSRRPGRKPIKVHSLADNVAWLTAEGNDVGYDNVFAGQLETYAEPGDVLIAISASGNSPSIITAVELARARGLTTIGLVGFDGGALLELVDTALHVRTTAGLYGPVEDAHLAVQHIISSCMADG
jgi:D-sedoheptulose 7-phosphate isomerase